MYQKGLVMIKISFYQFFKVAIYVIVYSFSNYLFHGNDVKYEIKVQTKN